MITNLITPYMGNTEQRIASAKNTIEFISVVPQLPSPFFTNFILIQKGWAN